MTRFARPLLRVLAAGLALSFALTAPVRAADADVIYPRSAAPSSAPGQPAPAPRAGNTGLLVAAFIAAAGGAWFLWRQRKLGFSRHKVTAKLALAETRPLGNRQFLVVATYEDQKFLLGVCPGRIELLTRLDQATAVPQPLAPGPRV